MKFALCLMLSLMLLLPLTASAEGTAPAHEFLALMTYGGSQGGGDEAAFIDTLGGIYYVDLEAEELYWRGSETLTMLQTLSEAHKIGELSADELAELRRQIDGIETVEPVEYGVSACDAGVFRQCVYRTLANGERQELTLLCAGDSIRENMDAIPLSSRLLDMMSFTRHLRRLSYLFPYGDSVPLSISFERGSFFGGSRAYTLRRSGDRVIFSVQGMNGDETDLNVEIDDARGYFSGTGIVTELQGLIVDENIASWNGFDERDDQILDGDGFSLRIDYGTSVIEASGYERYPEGYPQAANALEAFFEKLIARAREQE